MSSANLPKACDLYEVSFLNPEAGMKINRLFVQGGFNTGVPMPLMRH